VPFVSFVVKRSSLLTFVSFVNFVVKKLLLLTFVPFVTFVVKMLFALNLRDLRALRGKNALCS